MLFHKPAIHGIYALCYLSKQPSDVVTSAAKVAEAMQVPPEQAAKVLQALQSGGMVSASRGRSGGYRLAKALNRISLLEVIELLAAGDEDERLQPRDCPNAKSKTCSAYGGMVSINNRVRDLLARETLAGVVGELCEDHARTATPRRKIVQLTGGRSR